MPSKKNKGKENAFYYYMLERKPEMEKRLGRRVPMSEMPGLVHRDWKELPEERKTRFKEMCSDYKQTKEKYDSRGIPLSYLQEAEQERKNRRLMMEEDVKKLVAMLHSNRSMIREKLHVISMSYYVETTEMLYVPAEISVVQFTIKDGVGSTYHRIFPENIPLGYRKEAIDHSEATHKLLGTALEEQVSTFEDEFISFLNKDGGKVPILFTQEDLLPSVENMMSQFPLDINYQIYSLDVLMQHIYSSYIKNIPLCIAEDFLKAGTFDYFTALSCEWHQIVSSDSSMYCTMNVCHRWIFNIFHQLNLQDTFGITLVGGKHYCQLDDPKPLKGSDGPKGEASVSTKQMRGVAKFDDDSMSETKKRGFGFGRGRNRRTDN